MAEPISTVEQNRHYSKATFSLSNRIRRVIWGAVYQACFRYSPRPFYAWRIFLLRMFGARVHGTAHIYPKAVIWAPWLLKCDAYSTLADGVVVYNPGGFDLGHHAIASQDSYLCGATHDYNDPRFTFISKKISMEPYSWVCARAIVLPGVTLAEGAVLGAGAVATKSLEAWSVYGGNPAFKVKARVKPEVVPNA